MSVRKSIYKGLFWKVVFYLTVFLLNIFIARYFEASVSGLIFYVTNLYSFILLLSSFSIESGMTYFLSRGEISSSRLALIALIWTFICAILTFVGLRYYHFPEHLSITDNMPAISIFFISGMLLITFFSALLAAKKDFRTAFVCQSIGNLVLVVLLLVGSHPGYNLFNSEKLIYWYFAFFLIEGLFISIYFIWHHKSTAIHTIRLTTNFKSLLTYSFPVFISNIIYFLLYRVDYWFVEYYCDDIALGNYIQASKIAQLLIVVPSTISIIIFPFIAQGGRGSFLPELQLLSRVLLTVFTILCFIGILIGYWLFPFLLGNSFTQMYIPFLLLIPGILSLVSLYPYTAYFAGVNMAKQNIIGTLIGLGIVVIGDILLVPRYGIRGAALASSIGYLCFQVFIMRSFRKHFRISLWKSFLLQKSDISKLLMLRVRGN